jgi:chlorobactene glucosyltransferase
MEAILALLFLPLSVFAFVAVLNAFTFPRLKLPSTPPGGAELLSVLIPMRNEAAVIAPTVRSLLQQTDPHFEVLILDDGSEDGSAQVALQAANGNPRLRVLKGQPLPQGWFGKPWACHQLSTQASGSLLLFTDADVHWQPGAFSALRQQAQSTRADLLTVWPTQTTQTWGERLIVPLMAFSILAYLPVLAVHHLPSPAFAAAMGQCLLFRRSAYQQIGGHAAIRHSIVDDMAFAYAIKRHRLRLRAADANRFIHTRMYQNGRQVLWGFAKNILAGHANSPLLLLLSSLFHLMLFVLPWVLFAASLFPWQPSLAWSSFLLISLGVLTRALTALVSRQRIFDSFLLPLSVLGMTLIAVQSVLWRFTGKTQWKGRTLTPKA